MNHLKLWYLNIIKIDSVYKMNIKNSLQLPKIKDITINISSKSVIEEPKSILYYIIALKLITNQNPIVCRAKKSIALFKIRKGVLTGVKVSLKGESLYNFLNIFIFLILPNLKDMKFYKLTKGSLSIGIKDLLVFPQLTKYYDKFQKNVTAIINLSVGAKNDDLSRFIFSSIQLPIK